MTAVDAAVLVAHSTWDEIAEASHFLQDMHGEAIALVLAPAGTPAI